MFKDSLIILNKELRRIFTDKRMILMLIVVPLVMLPLMYSVMAKMGQARESNIESYRSNITLYMNGSGEGASGPVLEALEGMNASLEYIEESQIDSMKQAVAEKEIELLIVMPDDMARKLEDSSTFEIRIFYNSTSDYSKHAYDSVNTVLSEVSDEIVRERVTERGISQEILTVLEINAGEGRYDMALPSSIVGRIIGILLPFFIIIYLFVNSMKVGLDSVAGEKERGTLAVLLVNQVDRLSIVIGKMVSVMVSAIVGATSSVVGLIIASKYFMGMFGASGAAISSYSMGTMQILQFALVTVPLAVLIASMVLVVSTYARNPKEGQGIIMPVYFVVMIMGVGSMQAGDVPPQWMEITPIFNSLLVMKSIFMQEAVWSEILTACVSSVILAGVFIYLTLRMFGSEKVLFRI